MNRAIVIFKTEQNNYSIEEFEAILKSVKENGATHIDMWASSDGDFELSFYREIPRIERIGDGEKIREFLMKYIPRKTE